MMIITKKNRAHEDVHANYFEKAETDSDFDK